jgi:hypothetical protein
VEIATGYQRSELPPTLCLSVKVKSKKGREDKGDRLEKGGNRAEGIEIEIGES